MTRRTLRHIAAVACPPNAPDPLLDDVVAGTEFFLRALPVPARVAAEAATLLFNLLSTTQPATLGRRFVQLDAEQAQRYFARWWHSRLPPLQAYARAINSALNVPYFSQAPVQQAMNYAPKAWIERVRKQRAKHWRKDIEAHDRCLRDPAPLALTRADK